jgi:hypothetical protein
MLLPHHPAIAIRLLQEKSNERIAHVLAMATNDKHYHPAVAVIAQIRNIDEIVPLALPEIRPEHRAEVFADVGPPLEYFCRIAGVTFDSDGNFIGAEVENETAALALLVVLRDELLVQCFSAALFCLDKLKMRDHSIDILVHFLRSLTSDLKPGEQSCVVCCGITLRETLHAALKIQFLRLINEILVDRFSRFKLPRFVTLAILAGVEIRSFLERHRELAARLPIGELRERLRVLLANEQFPEILKEALDTPGWSMWTEALALERDLT